MNPNPPIGECVLHQGTLRSGYGRVNLNGRTEYAHRAAWIAANGPIPDTMTVDHTCHNLDPECPGGPTCQHRACVRVEHLELIDAVGNAARASLYSRTGRCKRGHILDEVGVYLTGDRITCRACHLLRQARYDQRKSGVVRFVPFLDEAGQARWDVIAGNGKRTATSGESFASPANARRAIDDFLTPILAGNYIIDDPDGGAR